MSNFNQNLVTSGLGTTSVTVPDAGPYFVEGKISLPSIPTGSTPSAVLVVVNKNGSPVYTGVAGATGFYCTITCAALDVIAVVLSSSSAVDNVINAIKTTIEIGYGE